MRSTLQSALGVTRVARVTGLDRAGVEVACAIRPLGHVLQVSNGKGDTWAEARASALSEAAELWAAERVDPYELVFGSAWELGVRLPRAHLVAPRLCTRDARIAWRKGHDLATGRDVLVPAQAVHCPPRGAQPLGPAFVRWTSNGLGAHPSRAKALRHALLEVCERDQLARALPHGWTARAIRERKLDARRLPLWRKLRDAQLEAHLFDLSGPALPVVGAILIDLEGGAGFAGDGRNADAWSIGGGPVPVTAGYACALTPERAARGALLEAAQSRLTEVHGAREDVAHRREEQRGLRAACEAARPSRRLSDLPRAKEVRLANAAVVDLASEPLAVVKVYAPDLRVSELL
jgi:ribosomal protein S12 methylthiotransferase accessory factor